jgi:hypothetical protein
MINNQLKLLSLLCIILILTFCFFKLNINKENLIFIIFIISSLIGLIIFYFSNVFLKKQIIFFISTLYISLFILELNYEKLFYSICKSDECQKNEKMNLEKKINQQLNYNLLPKFFIGDNVSLMPLSTFRNTYILGNNENDYYPYFLTDRYGFINNDKHYDQDFQDILIIGDSYAMGGTVNYDETLQGQLSKKGLKTLSFGFGGNGPLMALGSLIEFKKVVMPKKVIYLFSATNDINYDLFLEKKNKILVQYLNNEYKQNLLKKIKQIDEILESKYKQLLNSKKQDQISFVNQFKLSKIRYLVGIENKGMDNYNYKYNDNLTYTLKQAVDSDDINSNYFLLDKIIARMKHESGTSELFIFFIPEIKNFINNKKSNQYYAIKKISEKNNIKLIDIFNNSKIKDYEFRKSMYPINYAHPNEKGYGVWAETILENFKLYD